MAAVHASGQEMGLRAQIGVELYADTAASGGLNLYSTEVDAFEPGVVELAEMFAWQASLALRRSTTEDQLNQAIETRKVIGQAIGIVMERFGLTEERAFAFLVRTSSTSNMKLRLIAEELVRSTTA